ncbi:hypothetical protein SAMN06265222_1443 [Neorhodopirellula lusitana]|uniref:Uncharacterized protein n=1 Tax=Neorhodopirellula lusitana TaxID=445327 RepID=A0ABY1QVR2_9BACT|nr:hypothetical protein SAMN06265222_1443 [Neorhodopirellula lusitana]
MTKQRFASTGSRGRCSVNVLAEIAIVRLDDEATDRDHQHAGTVNWITLRITRSAREIFRYQNARLADSGASDGSPLSTHRIGKLNVAESSLIPKSTKIAIVFLGTCPGTVLIMTSP